MPIFEVVEDGEEESLEAPECLVDRKHCTPVLDRTRATIKWGFRFARKLQRPPCLNLSVYLVHELSEALGELWHQASVVTELSNLSFWT